MVRVFVPVTVVDNGSWSAVGELSPELCVDEGVSLADDATTYVLSNKDGDIVTLSVGPIDPPPALFTGHKLRVRARRDSAIAPNPAEFGVSLIVGGTSVYSSPTEVLTGTYTTFEYDLGLSALLADYNDLVIALEDRGGVLSRRVQVTAVEMEVGSEAAVSGDFTTSLSTTGAVLATGALSASVAFASLAATADIAANGVIASTTTMISFAPTATMIGLGDRSGTFQASLLASGSGLALGILVGDFQCSLALAGSMSATGALAGAFQTSLSLAGNLGGVGYIRNLFGVLRNEIESTLGGRVVHDNEPDLDATRPWARSSIESLESRLIGWNSDGLLLRYVGKLLVELRAPVDSGEASVISMYDTLRALSQVTLNGIIHRSWTMITKRRTESEWIIEASLEIQTDHAELQIPRTPGRPNTAEASSAMRTRFRDLVATPLGMQLLSDNQPLTTDLQSFWSRLSWKITDSQRVDQVTERNRGVIEGRLFCRVDSGDSQLLDAAQAFFDNMKLTTVAGVTLASPTITTVGRRGTWWQLNVSCPFFYDTTVN